MNTRGENSRAAARHVAFRVFSISVLHTKLLLREAINASDIPGQLLGARTQSEEDKGSSPHTELIRRCFLNSDAYRAVGRILKRREIRSSDRDAHRRKVPSAASKEDVPRRREEGRDDAGRSNCETGGPITGPEITGPESPPTARSIRVVAVLARP